MKPGKLPSRLEATFWGCLLPFIVILALVVFCGLRIGDAFGHLFRAQPQWRTWFAWRPVMVPVGDYPNREPRWLCTMDRRAIDGRVEYRLPLERNA